MSTVIPAHLIDRALLELGTLERRGLCQPDAATDAKLALAHLRATGGEHVQAISPDGARALVVAVVGVLHTQSRATRPRRTRRAAAAAYRAQPPTAGPPASPAAVWRFSALA